MFRIWLTGLLGCLIDGWDEWTVFFICFTDSDTFLFIDLLNAFIIFSRFLLMFTFGKEAYDTLLWDC